MTPELTDFFRIGAIKAFVRLNWRNVVGLIAGLLLGGQLGHTGSLRGLPLLLVVAACGALGLWLTSELRGLFRVLRWAQLVVLAARQLAGLNRLTPARWYTTPPPPPPVLRRRTWAGQPLVVTRPFGTHTNGTGTTDEHPDV
ncbi:MAG TPA: hypothetical protein VFS21_30005 [Roseiflexaceae bacterium]|nr:hypothetical protein [Roseiflexaceae bacterium]